MNTIHPQNDPIGDRPDTASPPRGRRDPRWKTAVVLLLLAAIVVTIVLKRSGENRKEGVPVSSREVKFEPSTILATVNNDGITLTGLQAEFDSLPEEVRIRYGSRKYEFLEDLIVQKIVLQEAKRLKVEESPSYEEALAGHTAHEGHEREALLTALLKTQVLDRIEVTEEELRDYYDQQKKGGLPGGDFEAVKESLRSMLLQQKQYAAVDEYVANLKRGAAVTRNENWVRAQRSLSGDNPLDKALATDRPVVADFGRGTCIPCKMMKPILEDLAKEYRGKAEILIIQIDEYAFLTRRCGIRVIPTQIFYDSSANEVYRHEGFMPKEDIREQLAKLGVK
ncbi:MAG: thioredoxin domain-containing protein [bacterium]|nr:thioredoxin domain-containing protein [bacterium]